MRCMIVKSHVSHEHDTGDNYQLSIFQASFCEDVQAQTLWVCTDNLVSFLHEHSMIAKSATSLDKLETEEL